MYDDNFFQKSFSWGDFFRQVYVRQTQKFIGGLMETWGVSLTWGQAC